MLREQQAGLFEGFAQRGHVQADGGGGVDHRDRRVVGALDRDGQRGAARRAGGVAHEINNALTIVLGFTQLAQRSAKGNQELKEDLQEILRAGRRAAPAGNRAGE